MERETLYDIDLTEYGFVDDSIETEYHIVTYFYYDKLQ